MRQLRRKDEIITQPLTVKFSMISE